MVEFRIISRGEGIERDLACGYPPAETLAGILLITPDPLLESHQLHRLRAFLLTASPRAHRRTKAQAAEAETLAALVRASTAAALTDAAREILLLCIEGKLSRREGRPIKPVALMSNEALLPGLAVELSYAIRQCLEQDRLLQIPGWGLIEEDPASKSLPLKRRALEIAMQALRERGYRVPSLGRLRNRISERGVAPVGFFVNLEGPTV